MRIVPRQTTQNGRKDCGGEMGVPTVPSGAVTTVCDHTINHCTKKRPVCRVRIALIALEMLPSFSDSAVMAVT